MKSIIHDLELDDDRTLYVQIGESGRVSLSFDGQNMNVMHTLTIKELKAYHQAIGDALQERAAQVAEEAAS